MLIFSMKQEIMVSDLLTVCGICLAVNWSAMQISLKTEMLNNINVFISYGIKNITSRYKFWMNLCKTNFS